MNITTLTPPGGEPLSLADAKAFARIGSDHDDALIADLIAAARARIEAMTGLALMSRSLRLMLTEWPLGVLERGWLVLPHRPAKALTAVRLTDGAESEDVTARFTLEAGRAARLKPVTGMGWSWPRSIHQWIEIDWQAGFGDVEDQPDDLLHALKLCVAHGYAHRGRTDASSVDDLQAELETLLQPWREVSI